MVIRSSSLSDGTECPFYFREIEQRNIQARLWISPCDMFLICLTLFILDPIFEWGVPS